MSNKQSTRRLFQLTYIFYEDHGSKSIDTKTDQDSSDFVDFWI